MKKILSLIITLLILSCSNLKIFDHSETKQTENVSAPIAEGNNQDSANNFINKSELNNESTSQDTDPTVIAALINGDIYYNQGNYEQAFEFYYVVALKTKNPQIIYKAILSHEGSPKINVQDVHQNKLQQLIDLLAQVAPQSNVSKIFQIRQDVNADNLVAAKLNYDYLRINYPTHLSWQILFLTTLFTQNHLTNNATTQKFINYVLYKNSNIAETHLLAVVIYAAIKDYPKLKTELNYIKTNYPQWENPIFWVAGILLKDKQQTQLLTVLNDFINNKNSVSMQLENIYIYSLIENNQYQPALNFLNHNTTVSEYNSAINYAIIFLHNKNYSQALKYLHLSLNGTLNDSLVYMLMGGINSYLGNYAQAIIFYHQAENNSMLQSIIPLDLAANYFYLNNITEAQNYLKYFVQINKLTSVQELLFKSKFYLQYQQNKLSFQLLNNNLSLIKSSDGLLYLYAYSAAAINQSKIAISNYKKFLNKHPNSAVAYNDLAYTTAVNVHNYSEALKLALQANKLSPQTPYILDTVGYIYYKMKKYTLAKSYLQNAYQGDQNYTIAAHLKELYNTMGESTPANKINLINTITDNKIIAIDEPLGLLMLLQFGGFSGSNGPPEL